MQQKYEEHDSRVSEETPRYTPQLQRLLQRSEQIEGARSLGEALVPFFLALVEACWFEGILLGLAGLDFLQTRTALLPFWGPPLLLCVSLWLFLRVLYREAALSETATTDQREQGTRPPAGFGLLLSTLALLALVLIWLHIYAVSNFLLDPRWLLAFANDLLSLNAHFYQALAIVAMTVYFCWRGSRLAQTAIEPGHVWRQMWAGLAILLAVILVRAGLGRTSDNVDTIVLVLLPPAFLYFALSAHALARISFVRRSHPFGLEGNIVAQERAVLSIIGGVGLVLFVVTLLGGALFSAAFFNSLHPAWQAFAAIYDWLTRLISLVLSWIALPIFWLITWLASLLPRQHDKPALPTSNAGKLSPLAPLSPVSPGLVLVSRILLPLLIVFILILVLFFIARRRKQLRIRRNRASGDVHESVWSWSLFWLQLKAFLATLFRRKQASGENAADARDTDEASATPAARTIRELYRALLQKATSLGYVRRRHETPREFQQRLDELHPTNNEPQLGLITEAYSFTRYGGNAPDAFDLARAQRAWDELRQKWESQA
jgi:hypothetical protein